MRSGWGFLVVLSVFLLLAVPSSAEMYETSNGTYTSSQTSSCFQNDYSKWGPDRNLAVGVSSGIFKVGRNGSPNACGVTMEMKCIGPTGKCLSTNPVLTVTVVDECKNCDERTIRLTLNAYNQLASDVDSDGIILGYRYV